jgi:hypothetical protein
VEAVETARYSVYLLCYNKSTCFTRTKVQILTPVETAGELIANLQLSARELVSLLALRVQTYKN